MRGTCSSALIAIANVEQKGRTTMECPVSRIVRNESNQCPGVGGYHSGITAVEGSTEFHQRTQKTLEFDNHILG